MGPYGGLSLRGGQQAALPLIGTWNLAGESAGAQSGDVAVAVAVTERGRPRGVQAVRRAGSTETSVRPASESVGAATSGEGARRKTHHPDHSGYKAISLLCDCVCHYSVAVLLCH